MVDIKPKRKLKSISGVLYISIPKPIVDKYKLEKDFAFEVDVIEEPELVILLKKINGEFKEEDEQNEEN